MPKSITFFSRGKTPIYVNYVIAHNTQRAARYALRASRSVVEKAIVHSPWLVKPEIMPKNRMWLNFTAEHPATLVIL